MSDLTHKDEKTGEVYRITHSELEMFRNLAETNARILRQMVFTNRLIVVASIILPLTFMAIVFLVLWHVDQLDWAARGIRALEIIAHNTEGL